MSRGEMKPLRDDQIEGLYRTHAQELRRFALGVLRDPALAEDVVQSSFAKLTENGPLPDDTAYRAWLFRVAYNEAVTLIRRKRTQVTALSRMAGWLADKETAELGGPGEVDRKELIEKVREAINVLPETERQVVQLRIYEQCKFREIAERLNIPQGTALSRMRTAMQKLANLLEALR